MWMNIIYQWNYVHGIDRFKIYLPYRKREDFKIKSINNISTILNSEYLTGFRKRKKQRQQHAKEEKEKKLKEDRKALKQQVYIEFDW